MAMTVNDDTGWVEVEQFPFVVPPPASALREMVARLDAERITPTLTAPSDAGQIASYVQRCPRCGFFACGPWEWCLECGSLVDPASTARAARDAS